MVFKFYCCFCFSNNLVLFLNVDLSNTEFDHPEIYGKFESSFRHAFFQIVAVITTTGFVTGDFAGWTPFLTMLFWIDVYRCIIWIYIWWYKNF